jgi:hypothetical protein
VTTGIGFVDEKLDALRSLPPGSLGRRALYALLVAVGVTMTGYGSIFLRNTSMIPYKLIPDLRGALLFTGGLTLGLYAAYGPSKHRTWALWGVLAFVIGFHLEEAEVHWIGPYPGSITGTPVGVLGTAGSLAALVGVLLLHVEVESARLANDLDRRGAAGATSDGADGRRPLSGREAGLAVAAGLRQEGARRVLAVVAVAAGLGLVAVVAERIVGHSATGGVYVLLLGSAILFGLAFALVRIGRSR